MTLSSPKHLLQFVREFDGLLDRHNRVLCPMLEQEGRCVGADIGLRVGGFYFFRDFGDSLAQQQKIRGNWLRCGEIPAEAAARSPSDAHPS